MSPYVVGGLNNRRFIDPFYIAQPAWEKGIHGSTNGIDGRYPVIQDKQSPETYVRKKMNEERFQDNIKRAGHNAAIKQQYQLLRFK